MAYCGRLEICNGVAISYIMIVIGRVKLEVRSLKEYGTNTKSKSDGDIYFNIQSITVLITEY